MNFDFLDDLRFDSTIFILGIDNYIEELRKHLTPRNKVFIFEHREDIYEKFLYVNKIQNFDLLLLDEYNLESVFSQNIIIKNFLNIYVSNIDIYENEFKEEFDYFYGKVDYHYNKSKIFASTFKTFKETYFRNLLSNLDEIENSICFDNLLGHFDNIPSLIISAGPSLDENIKTLVDNKDKLNRFLIIAGNRTLKVLIDNDITPDFVVSLDPQEITSKMIDECKDCKVPLIFLEHSNKDLVKNYKGQKFYTTKGSLTTIKGLEDNIICFSGGSVAHTMTHIAACLGSRDIAFLGQDFAYTNNKHHSNCTNFENESLDVKPSKDKIIVKDIFGEDIETSSILNIYKVAMEILIENINAEINFYNVSKGANINGTKVTTLEKFLNDERFNQNKKNLDNIEINIKPLISIEEYKSNIKNTLHMNIGKFLIHQQNMKDIKDLKYTDKKSIELFHDMNKDLSDFLTSLETISYAAYLEEFLFDIKEFYFKVKVCDYDVLSRNMFYQCSIFEKYLEKLIKLLIYISNLK